MSDELNQEKGTAPHPSPESSPSAPRHWRSPEEREGQMSWTADHSEFMPGASEGFNADLLGVNRRQFLGILAASAAFTQVACSPHSDQGEAIPYNKKPEEILPGRANHYASTCTQCEEMCGILVKTREGRPIKIDGNPDHPVNLGKICSRGHAAILNLYEPERIRRPLIRKNGKLEAFTWDSAEKEIVAKLELAANQGQEIALIASTIMSPTFARVLELFKNRFSTAKTYSYELFHQHHSRDSWKRLHNLPLGATPDLSKARIILSLESDFLGAEPTRIPAARQFAATRSSAEVTPTANNRSRLYCVEGGTSLTGMNADHRVRLRTDKLTDYTLLLIQSLLKKEPTLMAEPIRSQIDVDGIMSKRAPAMADLAKILPVGHLNSITQDLLAHRGASIVLAGSLLSSELHDLTLFLNHLLGNEPLFSADRHAVLPPTPPADLASLIRAMGEGKVAVAIHIDGNPLFHFPMATGYGKALEKVPTVITLQSILNETSEKSHYLLPAHDMLESWGDFQTRTTHISLQQPTIAPLFPTRQKEGMLLAWAKGGAYSEQTFHEFLKESWKNHLFPLQNRGVDFETFWNSALHDGGVSIPSGPVKPLEFQVAPLVVGQTAGKPAELLVVLQRGPIFHDGRMAHSGWLQELPHPVSKVVWDNYAAISEATAKNLKIETNRMIKVSHAGQSILIPVFVQPGMAEGQITIELGLGRSHAGAIGSGVGVNPIPLLPADFFHHSDPFLLPQATVEITRDSHLLVTSQGHHTIDTTGISILAARKKDMHLTRHIVEETDTLHYQNFQRQREKYDRYREQLEAFNKNPQITQKPEVVPEPEMFHGHPVFSITENHPYGEVKWGMVIDQNKCFGCTECVSGCNVENNIPVVGREQVHIGREMHWMRIDRYYAGSFEDPTTSFQPMLCQHCDNAPCENVCPVAATDHSPDGLNGMAYNRCVGTRYCANNCPYKVRRFNYFNFRDLVQEGHYEKPPFHLAANPEVTIRNRGVMEKCTFCVQKIMEERSEAIREGRPINGDNVAPACQTACPSEAISFGNINDLKSKVARNRHHDLGYHVLEELAIYPNVTYLAKIRNPSKEGTA